mgnify:CR=1 FL=1
MPKEHDPYPCIDKVFSLYWKLIEETQYDPDIDDFVSAQSLQKAIEQLTQIKEEMEIKS